MKNKKNSGEISALKLALIITASIVAAAGIIVLVVKLVKGKKKSESEWYDGCGCDCGCGHDHEFGEWFDEDEDFLGDLRFDDDAEDTSDEDEISAAVDEAIEAIEAATEEE